MGSREFSLPALVLLSVSGVVRQLQGFTPHAHLSTPALISLGFLIASHTHYPFGLGSPSHSNDRIKPHEQLVSVSLTPHSASTPDLSTSWARTTLQEGLALREVSSSGEFRA